MFLTSLVVGLVSFFHATQAEKNLRQSNGKTLKGSPYATGQTFVSGYSAGIVSFNWYYGVPTGTNTCPGTGTGTPEFQYGVVVGVCKQGTGTVAPNVMNTGYPSVSYSSSLTQVYTTISGSGSSLVDCVTRTVSFTNGATTTTQAAGLVTYHFTDSGCDPQYYLGDNYNTYGNVKSLFSSTVASTEVLAYSPFGNVGSNSATTTTCYQSSAGTIATPSLPNEYYSLTCSVLPNSVTNPQVVSWANSKLGVVQSNVPLPYYSNFFFTDPTKTTTCNQASVTSYSYIAVSGGNGVNYPASVNTDGVAGGSSSFTSYPGLPSGSSIGSLPTSLSGYVVVKTNPRNGTTYYSGYSTYQESIDKGSNSTNFFDANSASEVTLGYCSSTTTVTATTSQISLYYSATGPTDQFSDAVLTVYWYPNTPSTATSANACPAASVTPGATYQPAFQYSIYLGYCYITGSGSFMFQVGISGSAYEIVQITYTDSACTMNPYYTDSTLNEIFPFSTTPTNVVTPGTCYPATAPSGVYSGGGFYSVAISTDSSTGITGTGTAGAAPLPAAPTFGVAPLTSLIPTTTNGVYSQLIFQDSTNTTVGQTLTCTKPLYALYYLANTCLNINTMGWYEEDGKNGYLTAYKAAYVKSYTGSDGETYFSFYYYSNVGNCQIDTVVRGSGAIAKVDATTPKNGNSEYMGDCLSNQNYPLSINYNLATNQNYQITYTPPTNSDVYNTGYFTYSWYSGLMPNGQACVGSTCCSASPSYQYGDFFGYCLPIYSKDQVTQIGSYKITIDFGSTASNCGPSYTGNGQSSSCSFTGFQKTVYSDSLCSVNTITTTYPFAQKLATSTCTMAGAVPADGYNTVTVSYVTTGTKPSTFYNSPVAPQTLVPAPFISLFEFQPYTDCGTTLGFNYYSLNTCLNTSYLYNIGGSNFTYRSVYFTSSVSRSTGSLSYYMYKYTNTEACLKDIMIYGAPSNNRFVKFNPDGFCSVSNSLIAMPSNSNNFKVTYASVAPSVSNPSGASPTNGWLNLYEYYNEGCTGAPVQQFSMYLGYCYTVTNQFNQVISSWKLQLGATLCASGNIQQITYSDNLCTQNPIVNNIPLSTYIPTNSLTCTKNSVSGASGFLQASCTLYKGSTTNPTTLPLVTVATPYNSFIYYMQNQNNVTANPNGVGYPGTPLCVNPVSISSVIPNFCVVDINVRGTAAFFAYVNGRLMRYSYPSYTACMQDPYPKCTVTSSSSSNTYCTAMEDVTPTGTCVSDNTYNNVKYTYTPTPSSGDDDNLSAGTIAGVVIACVVFALLICVAIYFLLKCMKGGGGGSSSSA